MIYYKVIVKFLFEWKLGKKKMNNKFISIMTNRIVRDFDPLQIILFGSQARGDTDRDSDIDLLVVFSELTNKRKTAIDIGRVSYG